MKFIVTVPICLTLFGASCAPHASSVDGLYVSPMVYQSWECSKLSEEHSRLSAEVARLESVQNENANADLAMTTVGVLVAWPVLFGLAATHDHRTELAAAKGQYTAASQADAARQCLQARRSSQPSIADLLDEDRLSVSDRPRVIPVLVTNQTEARDSAARAFREPLQSSEMIAAGLKIVRDEYRRCVSAIRAEPRFAPILARLGDVTTGKMDAQVDADAFPTVRESRLLDQYWRSSDICRAGFVSKAREFSPAVANSLLRSDIRNEQSMSMLVSRSIGWLTAAQQLNSTQAVLASELRAITF